MLVDRPEIDKSIVRVTGPFVVEATIPTPVDWDGDGVEDSGAESVRSRTARSSSGCSRCSAGRRSCISRRRQDGDAGNIRPPAKCVAVGEASRFRLKAEATNGERRAQAGRVRVRAGERRDQREARPRGRCRRRSLKGYTHLYVIGFAIQPNAREFVEQGRARWA